MSGVKRYDYGYKDDGFGGARYLGLIEKPDGKLVRASDYERDTQSLREDRDSQQRACIDVMAERDALRAQVEVMRDLLRKVAPHFAAPPGLGHLHAEIDAALQAEQ